MKKFVALSFALVLAHSKFNASVQAEPGYAGEWKQTRLYGHSYNSGDFTQTQYNWIRDHFEYFTIEKTHMRSIYGNPSHEQTSKIAATRMITANPRCKPLSIYSISGAYPLLFESEALALTNHPDYFLYDGTGATSGLDLTNSGENDWYISTVNGLCTNSDIYGIFLDSFGSTYTAHPTNVKYIADRLTGFRLANAFDVSPNGLVIRDYPQLLGVSDGVFIDDFFRQRCASANAAVVMLDTCISVPNDYMLVCFGSYDGNSTAAAWPITHEFTHAAYLIVANDNTYYRWVGSGNIWDDSSLMTWDEDFGKEMGKPLGKATKSGYAYHRVFEHCTVDLDVSNKTSSIVWGQNNGTNQAPTAAAASYGVPWNQGTPILLTGTDPEGSNLTFSVVSLPLHGSLAGTAPAVTYTPTNGYTGGDSFTFTVSDGVYTSAVATVSIQVNAGTTNQAPTAASAAYYATWNQGTPILLTGTDPEGSNLTFSVVGLPLHGSLAGTAPALSYTPTNGYTGADSFTFTVSDGVSTSALATVTIQVNAAGSIAWATPTKISNANDISTNGSLVWAYNFGTNIDTTVNSVTFTWVTNATATGITTDMTSGHTIYYQNTVLAGGYSSLSTAYQKLVGPGVYGSGSTGYYKLTGLTNGQEYEVQFWANDSRNRTDFATKNRKVTLDGTGSPGIVVDYNVSDTSGDVGQFIRGTFTADATGERLISFTSGAPQLNAIQLRKISQPAAIGDTLSGARLDGTKMTLSWTAASGATYGVKATTNLVNGSWIDITNGIIGIDGLITVTNGMTEGQQFFRIYRE